MKLEMKVKEGFYITPKVYYETDGVKEIKKCKGVGSSLTRDDYYNLYNDKSIKILKGFFLKDIKNGKILFDKKQVKIESVLFKRLKVYQNEKWVNTKAIRIGNKS